MDTGKKRIAIFASGKGTNAANIIMSSPPTLRRGDLQNRLKERNNILVKENLEDRIEGRNYDVCLTVCNKPGAGVLNIAKKNNIPSILIEKEKFFTGDGYMPEMKEYNIDLVVLAGFLWKIPLSLIHHYQKKIINIHPALLPKYGGRGMYGHHVHQAVINAGEKESGITIHFVDEVYDHGQIIMQATCPLMKDDTADTLAYRIHQLEYRHFPAAIELVCG